MSAAPLRCPCGTGDTYAACCGRFHVGPDTPPTAARLMRARYSAFATGELDYVLRTWHPRTRPIALRPDSAHVWTGLEVVGRTGGTLFDTDGTVRFRAHSTHHGVPDVLAEDSRFVREDARWWYVEPV